MSEFLPADEFDFDSDGDTAEPLPFDLDGGERVQGSAVDLGPYESPFAVPNEDEATVLTDGIAAPYPNPSAGAVTIPLSLESARTSITAEVFDVLGRRVAVLHDGPLVAGEHDLSFDGRVLPAGVYMIRITGEGFAQSRQLTIIR